MFAQYPFISKPHVVALESTLRNHGLGSQMSAQLLVKIYKAAHEGLTKPVSVEGLATSRMETVGDRYIISSATDTKTGAWVQLAKVSPNAPTMLTIGQKWAMESGNAKVGNVAMAIW